MASTQLILARMREALSLSDPEWDLSVGTVEYKILEAVATEMASVYASGIISDYHFDVESKSGIYLDRFVELFGMTRLLARRAVGTVVFSTGASPATEDLYIAPSTLVYKPATSTSSAVYFRTVTQGVILKDNSSVEVPVECTVGGSIGNVSASSIIAFATQIPSVTSVTNIEPLTGGVESETDVQLRDRWFRSAYRSVAGTPDAYSELILRDPNVSKVLVVGASMRHLEELQVPVSLEITSEIPDLKYIYTAGTEFVGTNLGTASEVIGSRSTDYTFAGGSDDPTFTILSGGLFAEGDVLQVEFDFIPNCSRNNIATNASNCVDIFLRGSVAEEVTVTVRQDTANLFNEFAYPVYTDYKRIDGSNATDGNVFMPLLLTPIETLPETISVGETTYTLNVDYWLVRDHTTLYGSTRCKDGIEWDVSNCPANNASVPVTYTYNRLLRNLQDTLETSRPVGVDLLVHRAKDVYLRVHLSIVYAVGISTSAIDSEVESVLSAWLSSKDFAGNVQFSDLLDQVRRVRGVDNVRVTTSSDDAVDYGIQKIAEDGSTVLQTYTSDVYLNHDELPVLESLVTIQKAQNTF